MLWDRRPGTEVAMQSRQEKAVMGKEAKTSVPHVRRKLYCCTLSFVQVRAI